jgi:hypothetical protein
VDGYSVHWLNQQVLSVTTDLSSKGQRDIYLHAPGIDTHLHSYVPGGLSGATLGYSLKDRGTHAGPPSVASQGQNVPFARLDLTAALPNPHAVRLEAIGPAEQVSGPFSARTIGGTPRQPVRLPFENAPAVQVELHFVSNSYSPRPGEQLLTWDASEPWAIMCRTVPQWAGAEGE